MRQVEIDILNFENKLQQDRKSLNDLIYQCQVQGVGQDMMCEKIRNMQQEMDYMRSQLDMLQEMMRKELEGEAVEISVTDEISSNVDNGAFSSTYDVLTPRQQKQPEQSQAPPPERKQDLEKTVGKSWMGVIASGLVFISFIFFAIVLLPVLTDGMKMAAMFLISFMFTGVGLTKLRVDRKNKFYLALCGCGVGAVYISILVSNIYFKAINDIALYLLVFVWAVCVCWLRRMGSVLFRLIGQIGITVAILFGCIICIVKPEEVKVLMLGLFFAITSMIFMAVHRQKTLSENGISLVFNLVNLIQLLRTLAMIPDSTVIKAVSVILLLYIALHFMFCYRCDVSKDGLDWGIVTIACMILAVCFLHILLRNVPSGDIMVSVATLIICTVFLVLAERRLGADAAAGKAVIPIVAMLLMYFAVCNMGILDEHIYLAVLMFPFLCAGFWKRNWFFKYGSMIYMVLFQFHADMQNPEKMLWGFAYFGILAYFMRREKAHYQSYFKIFSYCVFLLKIFADCVYVMGLFGADFYTAMTVCCIVTGGINMAMFWIRQMQRNPLTENSEPETVMTLNIIHIMQMVMIISQILIPSGGYANFVNIPWALVLFLANTKKMLTEKKDTPIGIYEGIKFTILLCSVLYSCDIGGVPASICWFALAVTCIVTGFHLRCKSIRVYGLVLSMLSVFKLALVDIAVGGLLQLAVGFFASGILCFAISRIYNSIDEKMKGCTSTANIK